MKAILRIISLSVCLAPFLTDATLAASASASIKKGNSFYRQGKYDEALKYYNEAQIETPDSDVVNFNIGTALYQKGDYQGASDAFTKALLSDRPDIEEKAAYNIGNSKYRIGKLKENTDLASAIDFYRQALDYYKRAIELNQNNTDAKFNHEFVERQLKILLDKLKQQHQQAQQEKKDQGQHKQEQTESDTSGQEQKEHEQNQAQAAQAQEKGDNQVEQPLEDTEGYLLRQEEQKEMSREEAQMILERYSQENVSVGNMKTETSSRRYPPVLKDW
jgi:Ca-activated chloride channel family protein